MHISRPQNPTFSDLDDDILHLICSELGATSRASLLALAKVSPCLNAIATPYIFRDLLISPGPEGTRKGKAYRLLLQRLLGEAGNKLAENVRHLRVDGFESTKSLEAILGMCKNVRELSWHSPAHIPTPILHVLQMTCRDVKITVRNHCQERTDPSLSTMDEALLSCPQLVALEYTIIDSNDVSAELKQLLVLLQAGAHCKSLRIDTRRAGVNDRSAPFRHDFEFTLPSLEDVAIISNAHNGRDYHPYSLICFFMQRQNLRKLEVPFWTYDFPLHPDKFRNLRYLRTSVERCDGHEVASLGFFLESDAVALHGLYVEDMSLCIMSGREPSHLWRALQKQRHSLRELMMPMSQSRRSHHYSQKYLSINYMVAISEEFTALERLGLDIPLAAEGALSASEETQLDEVYVSQLTKMNLKTLDLYVFVPPNRDTVFAPKQVPNQLPEPSLEMESTLRVAALTADSISNAQRRPLQTLTMHISSEGQYPKEAKMQLRRIYRDDACALGIQKYRVIKRCEWRKFNEWELEDLRVFDLPEE